MNLGDLKQALIRAKNRALDPLGLRLLRAHLLDVAAKRGETIDEAELARRVEAARVMVDSTGGVMSDLGVLWGLLHLQADVEELNRQEDIAAQVQEGRERSHRRHKRRGKRRRR